MLSRGSSAAREADMRVLLAVLLCAAPAWARLCESGTFWRSEPEGCAPCTECGADDVQLFACQPFQDTLCEKAHRAPPQPVTADEAHRSRLTEERVRSSLQHANQSLQVERTRLETLVFEWQTTVFVVAILLTFALVFSFLAVLLQRTRTVIRKGVEDYSHLIPNRAEQHRNGHDQGSLAFADFDTIKIGRRPFDSPYSDLSTPRRTADEATGRGQRVSAVCVADYSQLPRQQV